MSSGLTNEEKKQLSYQRQNAVRNAWKEEKNRVSEGIGTRKWSENEQKELLEKGRVSGYEGHHMKSVKLYPEYAGDSNNIQFLTEDEHLYGAHKGDYHNLTNGYYDWESKQMVEFGEELQELPIYNLALAESNVSELDSVRSDYYADNLQVDRSFDDMKINTIRAEYDTPDNDTVDSNIQNNESNSRGIGR